MTPSDIPSKRLFNQHIASPRGQESADVVTWLGAMQGQDFPGALWSIGLRLSEATEDHRWNKPLPAEKLCAFRG